MSVSQILEITGGVREVNCSSTTLAGILQELFYRFPALRSRIMQSGNEGERLRGHILILHNDKVVDSRSIKNYATPIQEGDTIKLLTVLLGG